MFRRTDCHFSIDRAALGASEMYPQEMSEVLNGELGRTGVQLLTNKPEVAKLTKSDGGGGGDGVDVTLASGEVLWSYASGTSHGNAGVPVEVHAFQPLARGRMMIAESGPARILEVERDGSVISETPLTVDHPHPHMDTRLVRKIAADRYLVCHEGDGVVRHFEGVYSDYFATLKTAEGIQGRAECVTGFASPPPLPAAPKPAAAPPKKPPPPPPRTFALCSSICTKAWRASQSLSRTNGEVRRSRRPRRPHTARETSARKPRSGRASSAGPSGENARFSRREPRSHTTSPGLSCASWTGLPQPSPRSVPVTAPIFRSSSE